MVVESTSSLLNRPASLEVSHREAEHETLAHSRRHLRAVLSRQAGQSVALCGEVGIGKTFVLESLLREAACKSLYLSPPFCELDILQLLSKLEPSLHVRQHVQNHRTLLETLAKRLTALAPFVLVLEDIHELSTEQLEFIEQLASTIPKLRGVGLFVTSRLNVPSPFKGYWLERLNKQEVATLLEQQAKSKLPEEGLEWVFARSKGNPLFALEFWRYLSQQGYFWSDGARWHWRIAPKDFLPPTVRAVLHEWLSQVVKNDVAKRVLDVRALLPESVNEKVWAEVAGLEPSIFINIHQDLEVCYVKESSFIL
jgi:hypothetical protein